MLDVNFTFTCDSQTINQKVKPTDKIMKACNTIVKSKPEYYRKIDIIGMTLNGEKINPGKTFIGESIEDDDNIFVLSEFMSSDPESNINKENSTHSNEVRLLEPPSINSQNNGG